MFNILNIYETFDKKNKKKHEERKSGELDDKTKEKQQQAKIEEEKYDHLLNSMQAQTLSRRLRNMEGMRRTAKRLMLYLLSFQRRNLTLIKLQNMQ